MITHFKKNGTEIKEIAGYIVRRDDVPQVYDLIDEINRKGAAKNVSPNDTAQKP